MHNRGSGLAFAMLVTGVALNAAGALLVKLKMNELGAWQPTSVRMALGYFGLLFRSPLASAGAALFCLAPVFLAVAVSRMALSTAYPIILVLNMILVMALGVFFLGESITWTKFCGIALALASIYLLYE